MARPAVDHPHGTPQRYNTGRCRCLRCQQAIARAVNDYRKRRYLAQSTGQPLIDVNVPSVATQRRLRALQCMGWPLHVLDGRLGVKGNALSKVFQRDSVRLATADAVRALYDELWDKTGPSPKVATMARNHGYASPLAWDDAPPDDPEEISHWIEDPDAVPDLGSGPRQRKIDLPTLLAEIERGTTDTRMAEWFGCDRESLYQALRRHGHEGAADRLLVWSGRQALPGARRASRAS